MILSTITKKVAQAISTGPNDLGYFIERGSCNTWYALAHYNFYYSYPDWGKKWKGDQSCQFHRIEIKCSFCSHRPDRNYAGVGVIYLLHNGSLDPKIPMICLCKEHAASYDRFRVNPDKSNKQLTLF